MFYEINRWVLYILLYLGAGIFYSQPRYKPDPTETNRFIIDKKGTFEKNFISYACMASLAALVLYDGSKAVIMLISKKGAGRKDD